MPLKPAITRLTKLAILNLPSPLLKRIVVARRLLSNPDEVENTIKLFSPSTACNKDAFGQLKRAIKADMLSHLITPDEYFLYDFAEKSEPEKNAFVGDLERTVLCSRMYNSNPAGLVYMDKMATYRNFASFFKREVIEIAGEGDFEAYCAFADKHETYMIKPSGSSRGNGIRKESVGSKAEERRDAFRRILDSAPCVLEELIDQGNEMAALHPQSVNTIRYATFYDGDSISVICCFVKIGRGSSVVDNGGAGGFLAAVDEKTGKILTPGRTELDEVIYMHPDTGVEIVGYQIPAWNELQSMVAELVKVLPSQKYVGWDLAWSGTKGWVLVEGNSGGQFVGPQISKRQGVGAIIQSTFGRL